MAGLEPARLDWRPDAAGESAPHSTAFDDVYFSRHDGRAETEHVFLAANRLPERFRAWTEARPFVVGETGFGTGLNMLCTWACFDAQAPAGARLHLVSTERYPLAHDDLARALAAWPDLADRAAALLAQWPEPVAGVHRLWLDTRVTLDLHFGDTEERLRRLDGRVDAWLLDGFAPARNPEMWRPELFQAMAARSRPGATFATFTCAGVVKRGLKAAGFAWRKVPGFGRKREMLAGEIAAPPADERRRATPWFTPPAPRPARRVAVIGAGIAGAATAAALARRGLEVTLLDRQGPGAGASGNAQGALYVKLAAETNLQSRAYLAGLLFSRRWLQHLDPERRLWSPCGVLQLATDEREARRQARFLANHPLPETLVRPVTAEAASRLAGLTLAHGGLDYPLAGWVRPDALCRRLAETEGVRLRLGEVCGLAPAGDGWRLEVADETGTQGLDVDQVVIAAATGAADLAPADALPLQAVRGQVSRLALPEGAPAPARVVCAGGYVMPPLDGTLTFGASFVPHERDAEVREADHRANLAELERTLPGYAAALAERGADLAPSRLAGRAAVRAASPDKTPYAGPVPDAEAWRRDYAALAKDATRVPAIPGRHHPGLWINAAHGSRGLASAPLCAELLASRICDEPLPLELPLVDHLHPGRRLIRDLIRGGG
ncbi:bifunctional tRNA (5-methylaminomethyl-2-thiouridine)(34)-methyltransferase MnmD/FAD-dependent 5-carboxymethylaminomethyl-2-thiouridine(34) oxidoreductase MnmC [Halomonas koreensis]|uniref:tRNA 5-methylaminomethyl-2-thiouridine biosynthesis bifunctional protein MnmC n=1 Tax=Halomonas koreensis TaxID=245385 RepID=A0ABU1G1G9_9GAMM|nr:bifunctional tRNA (5-methylaminomethyl-2-thiouridine)(34)-methyltransferase MnmD/FAD-dependent 5-carboxymethylaminomethyl-2-thiouridine(34) oxidoreductase MnmC [Halomonas koreensis]MDR5866765.1 bifunctional tRNA (5-methylaminomethyl-2-thiouridine)(34)-methyltransferase MnmD/FAD-dependent 5-carboxymethylaminomethyl-2-thiouridine(34) oxidoreductase MnmC [Halomonas koreensis]